MRPITEKIARKLEQKLLLREYALDRPEGQKTVPFDPEVIVREWFVQSTVAVAQALEDTKVRGDPLKWADLINVVYEYARTREGEVDPRFVERMVRMYAKK